MIYDFEGVCLHLQRLKGVLVFTRSTWRKIVTSPNAVSQFQHGIIQFTDLHCVSALFYRGLFILRGGVMAEPRPLTSLEEVA
jgi:hypothetical protein